VDTPGIENTSTLPISTTTAADPSETKDGDAEMDLDEKDLAEVDLEHLEQAYRH
jgi:hypothetical protein